MELAEHVLRIVRAVLGDAPKELQKPHIPPADSMYPAALLDEAHEQTRLFEASLTMRTGARYAVALSSGTAALYCALAAAGVGVGDEVLCPSLTFAATANAIVMTGAVPHFIDSHACDLGVHPFKLRQYLGGDGFSYANDQWHNVATGRRIAAIVPVHLLGIPCAVEEISLTAAYYGITVIEDSAEALGSRLYTGDHCGLHGKAGILSFNLNKIVTTGGGGAVITNDAAIAERVRRIATQGKIRHDYRFDHDLAGFNFRMPPLCAALGINQLSNLPGVLEAKARLANRYGHAFRDIGAVKHVSGGNRWLNALLIESAIYGHEWRDETKVATDASYEKTRDAIITTLLNSGYGARAIFTPLHMLPHFRNMPRQPNMAGSEDLFRRLVCLPSSIGAA
jgi:perosamine synthetase